MHRIDGPGVGPGGTFREGDPSTGTSSTWVTADWANAVQSEIANVIEGAGLVLDKPDNGQLLAAIKVLYRLACPVGTKWEGYANSPPPGTLLLNGQLINRASYPDLTAWAVSQGFIVSEATWAASAWTMFGAGDGTTTLRLPDLREEFIRGVGAGRTVGSFQADELKAHAHQLKTQSYQISIDDTAGSVLRGDFGLSDSGFMGSTGGSETRPRNVALLRCIYY